MDAEVGLDWFASRSEGIDGSLKERPEDFRVDEVSDFNYRDEGRFAVIRVKLTNYDTHEFARDLSNELEMSRKRVSWAGTKDKRAVTTQIMTVDGVSRDKLSSVRIKGAEIEFLGRSDHPIALGDLKANEFEIRVRGVRNPGNIGTITDELASFGGFDNGDSTNSTGDKVIGVPNLFGVQRFGSRRPITHRVGERILHEDYEGAVMLFLASSFQDEPEATRNARERLEKERDYREALSYFPQYLGYERAVLNELVQDKSYKQSLNALPPNLRRLFVNAAQSYLFNLILRERYSNDMDFSRAYPGDVVCFTADGYPDTDRLQEVTESNADAINRHVKRGRAFVTAPLVGYKTEFSQGRQGEIEMSVLGESSLDLDDFDRDDEYASSGTRRPILVATDLEYNVEKDIAIFGFNLPKGSYATVVMREYLKRNVD
ncbi:MAG: tRNA pseudouridine(13) synthase TruD [Halobacteria archaeon]|nr:tRNA pseudouridine(13) synthase TruD [Halobacteria archaeon]